MYAPDWNICHFWSIVSPTRDPSSKDTAPLCRKSVFPRYRIPMHPLGVRDRPLGKVQSEMPFKQSTSARRLTSARMNQVQQCGRCDLQRYPTSMQSLVVGACIVGLQTLIFGQTPAGHLTSGMMILLPICGISVPAYCPTSNEPHGIMPCHLVITKAKLAFLGGPLPTRY